MAPDFLLLTPSHSFVSNTPVFSQTISVYGMCSVSVFIGDENVDYTGERMKNLFV